MLANELANSELLTQKNFFIADLFSNCQSSLTSEHYIIPILILIDFSSYSYALHWVKDVGFGLLNFRIISENKFYILALRYIKFCFRKTFYILAEFDWILNYMPRNVKLVCKHDFIVIKRLPHFQSRNHTFLIFAHLKAEKLRHRSTGVQD